MRIWMAGGLWASAAMLGAGACQERREIDFPDVNIPEPGAAQLEVWQAEFEQGQTWRGDPRRVAHEEIRLRVEVPWKGEPYDPSKYEFIERNPKHPDWGSYIVRGYTDRSRRAFRYRVKIARHGDIWYARQVSRYATAEWQDDFFDTDGPPMVR
ncbi:MAG: hypothetical protein HY716_10285 [Planctomycetes bacterium]|nr:hypothetical protein [Planctomycetota bacterium]